MRPLRHPSIEIDVERVTPLYDCVLVERIYPPAMIGSIHVPDKTIRPDELWDKGLRKGLVVAIGRGDKVTKCVDPLCPCQDGDMCHYLGPVAWPRPRHHMNVKPGDTVLYANVPDNDLVIAGKPYTMLREQQHIAAILED